MIIDCIADTHGNFPKLEGGDLLIVAGDLTANDQSIQYDQFNQWLLKQQYNFKVVIAGNHDNLLQKYPHRNHWKTENYDYRKTPNEYPFGGRLSHCNAYLCDSGTEFEYEQPDFSCNTSYFSDGRPVKFERKKLKVWGSPWTRRFEGMNPNAMAFTVDTEEELAEKFANIPDDVDILVTHSPPKFGLDKTISQEYVGSQSLRDWVLLHQPKLHVFGHIHEAYGIITYQEMQKLNVQLYGKVDEGMCKTTIINASHVNERYEPVNKSIRIEL